MRLTLLNSTAICGLAAMTGLAPNPVAAATFTTPAVSYSAKNTGGLDWTSYNLGGIATFDSTLGNLKSVLIVENLSAKYSGNVTETSTTTSGTAFARTNLRISGGPTVLDGNPALTVAAAQTYWSGTTGDLIPSTPQAFSQSATTGDLSSTAPASATWESVGPGTISLTLDSTTTGTSTQTLPFPPYSPCCVAFAPTVTETFNLSVAYVYGTGTTDSPSVPEPASALLLGSGVLALGKLRKRRKR